MLTTAITLNRLLASLPRKMRDRIGAEATTVDLTFGDILADPGQPHASVWFPLTGFISLVAKVKNHPPLELGLIGNEGVLGASVALGVDAVPMGAVVQGSGSALRLSASRFRRCLRDSPALERSMHRYLYVTLAQLAQSAACARFHEVRPRLARWLLMTHDRTQADDLNLTHQFLADMLGVRRSAVTIAAGAFQDQGLIEYTRGAVTVLDRQGLEAASCECYAATRHDYETLLGAPD